MSPEFKDDFFRGTGNKWSFWSGIRYLVTEHSLCYLYFLRRVQKSNSRINKVWSIVFLSHLRKKYGLEIPYKTKIGSGFYMGHAFNITINPNAVLGKNINIHKGVTIGQENRGRRNGAPTIADNVWIGVNATVVGNIQIGKNVFIAPNSYINFDVPENSIVIGNPGKVIPKMNATVGYINRTV
ncbi:serine O-acetyltransferase [Neobacillus sp. NPDC058068]|uniref:serine O-acetyltransferase n=1 Tax=Neobacillus sp. NPDC058068 TaxID=3346325 RepID=UPI0036D7ED22